MRTNKLFQLLFLVFFFSGNVLAYSMYETGPVIFTMSADGQRRLISVQVEMYSPTAQEEANIVVSLFDTISNEKVALSEVVPHLSKRTDAGIDQILRNFYFQSIESDMVIFPTSIISNPDNSISMTATFPVEGRWFFYFQLLNKSDDSVAFGPNVIFKVDPAP